MQRMQRCFSWLNPPATPWANAHGRKASPVPGLWCVLLNSVRSTQARVVSHRPREALQVWDLFEDVHHQLLLEETWVEREMQSSGIGSATTNSALCSAMKLFHWGKKRGLWADHNCDLSCNVARTEYKGPVLLHSRERINSSFLFFNMNFMFVIVFL